MKFQSMLVLVAALLLPGGFLLLAIPLVKALRRMQPDAGHGGASVIGFSRRRE